MQNLVVQYKAEPGFDSIKSNDVVGDHIKFVKHEFLRDGHQTDPEDLYTVLMASLSSGAILWEDNHISDIQARLVAEAGISDTVPEGYSPYTSVMLVDERGLLCTFTSSSWGGRNALAALVPQYRMQGKNAFPVVVFETRERGNQYGTIDPKFRIVGWAPRSKFAMITGDEVASELAAPVEQAPTKRRAADIIDDDLPF